MDDDLDTLADRLARDALAAEAETGDDRIVDEVGRALGQLSPSMQEIYMTSVRMRRAAARGRARLTELVEARRAGREVTYAPMQSNDGH
jgi:limonene-1,2-epoxide hydrolase